MSDGWKTRNNNERIRDMAVHGNFSAKTAEQLIIAGVPSQLATRTFMVSEGRGCSITAAYALLVKEEQDAWPAATAPLRPTPAVATSAATQARPAPKAVAPAPTPATSPARQQVSTKPVDTWDAAIAAVHAEFGIMKATGE